MTNDGCYFGFGLAARVRLSRGRSESSIVRKFIKIAFSISLSGKSSDSLCASATAALRACSISTLVRGAINRQARKACSMFNSLFLDTKMSALR